MLLLLKKLTFQTSSSADFSHLTCSHLCGSQMYETHIHLMFAEQTRPSDLRCRQQTLCHSHSESSDLISVLHPIWYSHRRERTELCLHSSSVATSNEPLELNTTLRYRNFVVSNFSPLQKKWNFVTSD